MAYTYQTPQWIKNLTKSPSAKQKIQTVKTYTKSPIKQNTNTRTNARNHSAGWNAIEQIVIKGYPNGDRKSITDRLYYANATWKDIAKIINSLSAPNHYANQNAVIRAVLKAKGGPSSNNESSSSDGSSGGGTGDGTGYIFRGDGDTDGNGTSSSSESQEGTAAQNEDLTFEDIISSIASAIDAHWYIVNDKVYFNSFNTVFAGGYEKTGFSDVPIIIDYWMQEDGSLELNLNQYGFYNTVYVKYKHGIVKATNDDLVRVYDEVPITYNEPTLGYYEAKLKAEAYLSAHIRDFNMDIKVSTLYTAKIKVGSFIKLKNPLTMSENLYYVYGISVSWDAGENTFIADLDLRFGPENPDNPEIPEVGMSYTSSANSISQSATAGDICSIAQSATQHVSTVDEKIEAWWNFWKNHMSYCGYPCRKFHNSSKVVQKKCVNCADGTMAMTDALQCIGAQVKIKHCTSVKFASMTAGHYYNEVLYKGRWIIIDSASNNGWGGRNMLSKSGCHYEKSTSGIC